MANSNNDNQLPFTERCNEITASLDGSLPPAAFLATLRSCDQQVFSGYKGEACLLDECIRDEMDKASQACASLLHSDRCTRGIVMTGCGTSGRVAFLTQRRYQCLLEELGAATQYHSVFKYTIAGGDSALLLSDEIPEDDPVQGARDLMHAVGMTDANRGDSEMFLLGVTCGISAPYVAGQLAEFMPPPPPSSSTPHSHGLAVIGFNPVSLARDVPIATLQNGFTSFRDVAVALHAHAQTSRLHAVINPIVGPEPVTASSRMKGGTATLVILDIVCLRALQAVLSTTPACGNNDRKHAEMLALARKSVLDLVCDYQRCHAVTYASAGRALPAVMQCAADSVLQGGRLLYVGIGNAAIVGGTDASEMPDTYGAPFDQTRAFVLGGWAAMRNTEGDLSHVSYLHRIGLDHFEREIVPTLRPADTVVLLLSSLACVPAADLAELVRVTQLAVDAHAKLALLVTADSRTPDDATALASSGLAGLVPQHRTVVVDVGHAHAGFHDLATKLMANAVSTYAQAAGRGALFRSLMISTGPANDKIYSRCVRLISENVRVSLHAAEAALLRSIYGVDDVACVQRLFHRPRIDHIRAAVLDTARRHESQVTLPIAFLLAFEPHTTVAAARERASREPRITVLLKDALSAASSAAAPSQAHGCHQGHPHGATGATGSTAPAEAEEAAREEGDYVVGIDVGGTFVRAAAIAPHTGRALCATVKRPIADRAPAAFLRVLAEVFDTVVAAVEGSGSGDGSSAYEGGQQGEAAAAAAACGHSNAHRLVAIGVGQPGSVAADGSIFALASFPNWTAPVPLRAHLVAHSGCARVFVFDDADSALAAEVAFGAGRLCDTVVMLTVGTGLGTAVAIKGQLFKGSRGLIEGGHTVVAVDGDACSCGQNGCLELYCSAAGIVRAAQHVHWSPDGARGDSGDTEVTAEQVVQAAHAGDPVANAALDSVAQYLAIGVLNLVRCFDPSVVVLAGGLGGLLLPRAQRQLPLVQWRLHDDAKHVLLCAAVCEEPGVRGAAMLAFNALKQETGTLAPAPVLRPAHERDRAALYEVCLLTGDAGRSGEHLFSDRTLLGQVYVGPYLTLAPQFAFCLDVGGRALGYTLGVLDTAAFARLCEEQWWPLVRRQYPLSQLAQYRASEQALITNEIHGGRTLDAAVLAEYPSHLHIDLVPSQQARGYGKLMIRRLLAALRLAGSPGVHLVMAESNERAFGFYTALGFTRVKSLPESSELVLGLKLQ